MESLSKVMKMGVIKIVLSAYTGTFYICVHSSRDCETHQVNRLTVPTQASIAGFLSLGARNDANEFCGFFFCFLSVHFPTRHIRSQMRDQKNQRERRCEGLKIAI